MAGIADNSVQIYEFASGRLLQTIDTGYLPQIAWSPDGQKLASANTIPVNGYRSTHSPALRIWDVLTGKLLLTIQSGLTESIAWSPDGTLIVSGDRERYYAPGRSPESALFSAAVWDTNTGEPVYRFSFQRPIKTLEWRPDGTKLAILSEDSAVRIISWTDTEDTNISILNTHMNAVLAEAWSPDGKQIATVSEDGGIRVWDATTGKLNYAQFERDWPMLAVAWSPDGKLLASGGSDFKTTIRDASTGKSTGTFLEHLKLYFGLSDLHQGVVSLRWSPHNILASGGTDGKIQIWRSDVGNTLTIDVGEFPVQSLSWSADEKTLLSASGAVNLWDAATGKLQTSLRCENEGIARQAAFSPDGYYIAGGYLSLCVWDAANHHLIFKPNETVFAFAWHPNSHWIAAITQDSDNNSWLRIWDIQTQAELFAMPGSGILAWSPDGKLLAASAKIWEVSVSN